MAINSQTLKKLLSILSNGGGAKGGAKGGGKSGMGQRGIPSRFVVAGPMSPSAIGGRLCETIERV